MLVGCAWPRNFDLYGTLSRESSSSDLLAVRLLVSAK